MLCITAAVPQCRTAAIYNTKCFLSTCNVSYLSPTSPTKAKSIIALRGNISDHRWLSATSCCYGIMEISPRCGSHKAAPIAMSVARRKYHYPSAYIMAEYSCCFNLAAIQRKVSEILLLNFQGTVRKIFTPS